MADLARAYTGTDSVTRSIILAFTSQVIARALSFGYMIVSTSVLYSYWGQQRFGIWATVFSLTLAFSFLDFGVANATLSTVAVADRMKRRTIVATIILTSLLLSLIPMTIVMGLGLIVTRALGVQPLIKDLPPIYEGEARQLVETFLFLFALSFPVSVLMQAISALQRQWISNACNACGSVLATLGVVAGVRLKLNLGEMLLVTYGVQIFAQFIPASVVLWHRLRGTLNIRVSRMRRLALRLAKLGMMFFFLQLALGFGSQFDPALLSSMVGAVAVSDYTIVQRLFQIVIVGASIVIIQLWPTLTYLHAAGEASKLRRLFVSAALVTLAFAIPLAAALAFFQADITEAWLGVSSSDLSLICTLYAVWVCLQTAGNFVSILLNSAGLVARQILPATIFAATALVLKVLFVPHYGLAALISATIAGYGLGLGILLISSRRKLSDLLFTDLGQRKPSISSSPT